MSIRNVIRRLGEEERRFAGSLFVAPVLAGGRVRVRLAGVVCTLRLEGQPGWAVCRAHDERRAEVVRPATPEEVRGLLRHLPSLRAVLAGREGAHWLAAAANAADRRLAVEGLFPVILAEGVREFEAVVTRFDGGSFLFEARDRRRDPSVSEYLRDSLARLRPVEELRKRGLTAVERDVYAFRLGRRQQELKPPLERRLEGALGHAGARLESYVERGRDVTVTFLVDGERFTSVVSGPSLEVVSAGICLSGRDRSFDLTSLVGVLRQARDDGVDG